LVSASQDKTVRVWNVDAGEERAVLRGHRGPVYGAIFARDGKQIVSVSDDKTLRIWKATTCQELSVMDDHDVPVYALATTPDGKTLAYAGGDDGDEPRIIVRREWPR
jgi:WD40 repeat protein